MRIIVCGHAVDAVDEIRRVFATIECIVIETEHASDAVRLLTTTAPTSFSWVPVEGCIDGGLVAAAIDAGVPHLVTLSYTLRMRSAPARCASPCLPLRQAADRLEADVINGMWRDLLVDGCPESRKRTPLLLLP